ncbi:hypothetical protein [Sunxiuqinia sp. sy24]|uniref:hypothetical protein n=1 Tax=Sunxiuqinia sp. sy24 TaxID=3461495 RepID=UPI004045AAC6
MKKFYFLPILALMLVSLLTDAQENKKEQLWYCYVETVAPEALFEYQEMSVELVALAKEHDFPFSFYVWSSRDLEFEVWYPINSLDDINAIDESWNEIIDQWGQEKAMAFGKTKTKNNSFTMTTLYELSYQPTNPRPEIEEAGYLQYQEFHLIPGKQKEMEAIIQDANKLLAEHNYNDAWYIAKAGIGMQMPSLIAWSYGKDAQDFYTQDKKFQEELGEAFKPLNKRFINCLASVKSGEVFYKKTFSYEKE